MRLFIRWTVLLLCLCACSTASKAPSPSAHVLTIRPAGYHPVELSADQFRDGMRILMGNGSFPGVRRPPASPFVAVGVDPAPLAKAAGYLQFCEGLGRGHTDCWDVLTPQGGLDEPGSRSVALRIAFGEALQEAASAVRSLTPDQVRLILDLTLVGAILALVDPNPWTKTLFMVATANLIAYVGVDLFNHVVKGYFAMAKELEGARDFRSVQLAGERYGQRMGPTLARLVVMAATIGVAKFMGLVAGGATTLPGGPQAETLAQAQGFQISTVEGAQSATMAADGSVTIHLGASAAVASAGSHGGATTETQGVPQAKNPRLQSALRELFRESDKIPGGTAGAIRHELKTGELVGGKSHLLKGQERAIQLERILAQENLDPADRSLAERLLQDLRDALAGR